MVVYAGSAGYPGILGHDERSRRRIRPRGRDTSGRDPGELAVAAKERERVLAENAEEIRKLGKRAVGDVIEIGRRLTEMKKICCHGNWLPASVRWACRSPWRSPPPAKLRLAERLDPRPQPFLTAPQRSVFQAVNQGDRSSARLPVR
jgi:hypothetical protein